ncbi:MAG TPA: arsenical pump-driving ATPase, partial [Betaproteobacteria bacterium]|nr:arsenical pump-driving ATPase [Betaproteobacteria bacterium]
DPIAAALERRGAAAIAAMSAPLAALPRSEVVFVPQGLVGATAMRAIARSPAAGDSTEAPVAASSLPALPPPLAVLVDELAEAGRGVIMTMGKGGVGKTTTAAAIAAALARNGHRVLLTTTDPAAHVASAIGTPGVGLRVGRIDPAVETRKYRQEVMAVAGAGLDAQGRALLEEELNSPCTEEIAVFRAFARAVAEGEDGFVVLDTAPTGHTILLLDAAEAYHREIARNSGEIPREVRQLSSRLRDAAYTRVLVVTLPEATPVHEAERLQADLRRAGIEPFAWVINQSFLASGAQDPLLLRRGRDEIPFIQYVGTALSSRCALIPWLAGAVAGQPGLRDVLRADAA